MSQTKRPTTLRGNTGRQRSRSRQSSKRPAGTGPAQRGDTPSKRSTTEGGHVFGGLVASQRLRLGLTQSQLAARMQTSRSRVARIEQGQLPDAETQRQLSLALDPGRGIGPLRRLAAWVAARRVGLPHVSRLLGSSVVVVLLISVLVVLDGRSSNAGPAPSSLQPSIATSDPVSPPAAIRRSRVRAKKAAAARIAAKRAAAGAGKAPANDIHQGILAANHPVTESGSPSSGGGAGGGGSGRSGPDLTDHGVGSHGGNALQGAAPPAPPAPGESSSGGGSAPRPPSGCVLPGILC